MSLRWLLASLALALFVGLLHWYNLVHQTYFYYWWVDIPLHLLASATISAFVIGLSPVRRPLMFLTVVAGIAIGWEVFEYVLGIAYTSTTYYFDTAHDLLDDAIGASVTYTIARKTIWR